MNRGRPMLVIEMKFIAGRYHATPWGRNVNEGVVEWPPSPYRLARALVDMSKRRKPGWTSERLENLLTPLSSKTYFQLPPAIPTHTRAFLSSNQRDPSGRQKVFDPFVVLSHGARIVLGFECEPPSGVVRDLAELLREMNYFGRSESWVTARVVEEERDIDWNCLPLDGGETSSLGERVQVACLKDPNMKIATQGSKEVGWLDALCMTTKSLLKEGWSSPPALQWIDYARPAWDLNRAARIGKIRMRTQFHFAKYALSSKVLPRIQETVSFAERIRSHLMGIHKRLLGDPGLVSSRFSGKGKDGMPLKDHRHVFYLPLDEDKDGRLDHLLVRAPDAFNDSELAAIDLLQSVWQPNGRPDVRLTLVSLQAGFPGSVSRKWSSATPFVTSRHYRKGRGTYEEWLSAEITRECSYHSLPTPRVIEWVPHIEVGPIQIRWMEFMRSRKNKSPLRGHGCILTFDEDVRGPFALGSGCHFGLGLFVPC